MIELATTLAVFISSEVALSKICVHKSLLVGDPPVQVNPFSTVVQSADHPSLSDVFPSSQVSPGALNPSPQISGVMHAPPFKVVNAEH
jgi:hypothetical protein